MHTSPEGNDGGSAAPEGAEALLARADIALQEEVLRLLAGPESQKRREHLCAIGALPTTSSDCAAVQEWILTTFREFNELTDEQEETGEGVRRYQELANLLCLAGIAIPITFRDWKVDRVTEAEHRWGLREGGTAILEELLVEQCAPPRHARQPTRIHLHKGPGNGQLMHHLRSESGYMEEVGVGDRLYFTIESVLLQYVRSERREDPMVRQIIATLSQALQGALHERWFEPVSDENGIIQRWKPKGFVCDLNDIFPLLAHPQEWLPNIYKKMMKALYRASEEFEDDRIDMVPHAAQEYIVQLADCEVDYAQAQCQRMQALHSKVIAAMEGGEEQSMQSFLHEFWLITGHMLRDVSSLADLSAKILETLNTEKEAIRQRRAQDSSARKFIDLKQGVDKKVQRLHALRVRVSRVVSSADTETLATDFAAIAEHVSLPDGGWTHALLADAIEGEIARCQEQSRGFKRQIQAARQRGGEVRDHARQTASASEKLQEIFTDEFATEITEHEQYEDPEYRKKGVRLDLNRSGPVMHFRRFIPGRFTSTLGQVPSESCLLISASRADSHEPSTQLRGFTGLTINLEDAPGEFEEDVGLTLNLVANISLRFDPEMGIEHLVTHFQRQNEEKLQELSAKGVIFTVGGSWFNPDDPYGRFFQQSYGKLIHSALATQGSPARGLFICFGHQNMMDLIGEAHRGQLPDVRSGPGALEFCPTPVHVRDARHPLFRDCPSRFTLMNTHGRHVDGLDNIQGSGQRYVRPVAFSELTGLPIMCDLYQGRAYSMQTHPEVDLVTERDRDRIMNEVDVQGTDMAAMYNIGTRRLRTMWTETSGHLQANAGGHILTNALLRLSADIPIHGRPWKGRKSREELRRRGWGRWPR